MVVTRDVTKILERLNMAESKPIGFALSTNCKLNAKKCSKSEKHKAEMRKGSYASVVGSLYETSNSICSRNSELIHDTLGREH